MGSHAEETVLLLVEVDPQRVELGSLVLEVGSLAVETSSSRDRTVSHVARVGYTANPMRAFLELLGSQRSIADLEKLAPLLAPGELEALRVEGFLQPTGSDRFDEISVPDVIRTVRALWGAGAGGIRTRSIMTHAPMTLGCLEIDAEPVDLVLVTGDAYSLEAAAKRRERSIVLVPTDHALTTSSSASAGAA